MRLSQKTNFESLRDPYGRTFATHIKLYSGQGAAEVAATGKVSVGRVVYLDVRDPGQGCPGSAAHRGSGEYGEQADGDASRRRLHVDPEGHPRQDDDEHGRHVDLDEEEADVSPQVELHLLTREVACTQTATQPFWIGIRAGFTGAPGGPGPMPPTNRGPPTKPFIFFSRS